MVLDSSAVVAILQNEPEAARLVEALEREPVRRMSVASLVESSIVMQGRYGDAGDREFDVFVQRARVDLLPVSEEHAEAAREAFRRFGRGRHPAALNYGDCFAYALATTLGESLLFIGEDFGKTDVDQALW